jgi:cytochrome b
MSGLPAATAGPRVRVWDLPVRLVHWLIVILVALCWWTAEKGHLEWHRLSGYGALGLILFRIYWGFAGGETARFSRFLRGPGAVVTYARSLLTRRHAATLGHNPMGGWSVLALLVLLLAETLLGLVSVDIDGIESGPLSYLVSFDTGRLAANWHHQVFNVLLALIVLHIAAVIFYLIAHRENLVGAMIGGHKRRAEGEGGSPRFVSPWRAVVGVLVAAAVTAALAGGLTWAGVVALFAHGGS